MKVPLMTDKVPSKVPRWEPNVPYVHLPTRHHSSIAVDQNTEECVYVCI